MAAQRVHATTRASDVTENQLQDRRGANDLRPESVLCPTDRINDRARLFHIPVFAN